jgi:hypothetical protein
MSWFPERLTRPVQRLDFATRRQSIHPKNSDSSLSLQRLLSPVAEPRSLGRPSGDSTPRSKDATGGRLEDTGEPPELQADFAVFAQDSLRIVRESGTLESVAIQTRQGVRTSKLPRLTLNQADPSGFSPQAFVDSILKIVGFAREDVLERGIGFDGHAGLVVGVDLSRTAVAGVDADQQIPAWWE